MGQVDLFIAVFQKPKAIARSRLLCLIVSGVLPSTGALDETIAKLSIEFMAVNRASAMLAGTMWWQYRRGGVNRTRVMADFLVAAHAQKQCEYLLTRDCGFYQKYFETLSIVELAA